MFQVIHLSYKKGTLACIACLCFEIDVCPWPDLSALFQYTSPTPVVSLHLIPRIQYHPGIPGTLLTGSSWHKGGEGKGLTRPEKARLLAKSLVEWLVKSALYAESMDNITVFVALLPGFSMVNWQMVTPDILEALDEFMADDDLFE